MPTSIVVEGLTSGPRTGLVRTVSMLGSCILFCRREMGDADQWSAGGAEIRHSIAAMGK